MIDDDFITFDEDNMKVKAIKTLLGRNDKFCFNCLIPDLVSDVNKDIFSLMTFIDWTYSYEFVTMVGGSGKYGEYNSFNLDILYVMDLFKIIIYLFAFSRREIIFVSSSMLLDSRVDMNFVIS